MTDEYRYVDGLRYRVKRKSTVPLQQETKRLKPVEPLPAQPSHHITTRYPGFESCRPMLPYECRKAPFPECLVIAVTAVVKAEFAHFRERFARYPKLLELAGKLQHGLDTRLESKVNAEVRRLQEREKLTQELEVRAESARQMLREAEAKLSSILSANCQAADAVFESRLLREHLAK